MYSIKVYLTQTYKGKITGRAMGESECQYADRQSAEIDMDRMILEKLDRTDMMWFRKSANELIQYKNEGSLTHTEKYVVEHHKSANYEPGHIINKTA